MEIDYVRDSAQQGSQELGLGPTIMAPTFVCRDQPWHPLSILGYQRSSGVIPFSLVVLLHIPKARLICFTGKAPTDRSLCSATL